MSSRKRRIGQLGLPILILFALPAMLQAQTATTGTIVGTVRDSSGAMVPGATVEATDLATKAVRSVLSNDVGQYVLSTLMPGSYDLKVTAAGFQAAVVTAVKVEVAKAATVDVELKVGALTETVTVTGESAPALQTLDATLGEVVNSKSLENLPTVTRRVVELAFLQVATMPNTGNANVSRSVAGARGDQNTFILDGMDVSDTQVGGTCCGNIGMGIPLPVEAVEEFRASVTNQNASFGRSTGGQYAMTTRRGSASYHGGAYWYHRNDNLNANTWARNRLTQKSPEIKDNRAGVRLGGPLLGPILQDRLFFFANWESRRYPKKDDTSRLVPSDTLRQGILRFVDNAGNVINYDLKTSAQCGPNSNTPCDPRGIGISPMIIKQFALLPAGNDTSLGDGRNTIGVRGPVDTSIKSDNFLGRVDFKINDRWNLNATYIWALQSMLGTSYIDIRGGASNFKSLYRVPNHPFTYNVGLTGNITPTLINELRFGFNRSSIVFENPDPSTLIQGAGMALDLAGLDEPYDISASRAQIGISSTYQLVDNFTWIKGKHTFQGGVNGQWLRFYHSRKGSGGLNVAPMAQIGVFNNIVISSTQRPPTCAAGQANCLRSTDVSRWNSLYATVLGMVDNTNKFTVRNVQTGKLDLTPQILLEGLTNEGTWKHLELHFADTWRVTNTLTLSLGVNGLIETPFVEDQGRRSFMISLDMNQPVWVNSYLDKRAAAALKGQGYNPGFAYAPTSNFPDRGEYPTVKTLAPRLAAAWNPSFREGLLGRVFGQGKTVFRGGYGLGFNRLHSVGTVQYGFQGNAALGQPNIINVPPCNFLGTPGAGCTAAAPFRVGVDGSAPLPPVADQIPVPYVVTEPFGQDTSQQWTSDFKMGHVHSVDFTIQRELPWNLVMEIGWIGRYGRNLMVDRNHNAVPFFITDLSGKSNQTFAQAYDLVAAELRAGVTPAKVAPQPWFENSLAAGATVALATSHTSNFISALVRDLWFNGTPGAANQGIDPWLISLGRQPINNRQIRYTITKTYGGWSNYNGMIFSLTRRMSNASFNFNYTFSKNMETLGGIFDSSAGTTMNPYDLSYAYGPSFSDRTHGINLYGMWELPFGPGRMFSTKSGVMNKVIGGWQVSSVMQWFSGRPLFVAMGGQPFGSPGAQESVPAFRDPKAMEGRHFNVAGSGGVGTTGNPATGGTGLNLFADPQYVFESFRPFKISEDGRSSRGLIRGLPWFTLDISVSKRTRLGESASLRFGADLLNFLNHPLFNDPSLNLLSPTTFGVLTSQPISDNNYYGQRQIQLFLRVEF